MAKLELGHATLGFMRDKARVARIRDRLGGFLFVMRRRNMHRLLRLNTLRWYLRVPIKWLIFAATVLAVCFPYPHRLAQHVRHWRRPNALIKPDAPALVPLLDKLRPRMTSDLSPPDALKTVQDFVYDQIDYAWDWETWGMADYLPTLTEAIEMGKEDCDGRAVVAASLLRNFGYQSWIVTDLTHVWVKTDKGETMHPGKRKAAVATERGIKIHADALAQLPRALAYGVSVFPLGRELIILVVFWLLLLRQNGGVGCSLVALAFLLNGLLFLRVGSADHRHPVVLMQVVALANSIAALIALLIWAKRNARLAEAAVDPQADATGS